VEHKWNHERQKLPHRDNMRELRLWRAREAEIRISRFQLSQFQLFPRHPAAMGPFIPYHTLAIVAYKPKLSRGKCEKMRMAASPLSLGTYAACPSHSARKSPAGRLTAGKTGLRRYCRKRGRDRGAEGRGWDRGGAARMVSKSSPCAV